MSICLSKFFVRVVFGLVFIVIIVVKGAIHGYQTCLPEDPSVHFQLFVRVGSLPPSHILLSTECEATFWLDMPLSSKRTK